MCKNLSEARYRCKYVFGHQQLILAPSQHPCSYKAVVGPVSKMAFSDSMCEEYKRKCAEEVLNPPEPITQKPPHIQRLTSRSRDNQVPFDHRFEFDYMGNSYFEVGSCAKRIREMAEVCGTGETTICGHKIKFVYNMDRYNESGAAETIKRMWDRSQTWWIEEDPYFDRQTVETNKRLLKDRKGWRDRSIRHVGHQIDAWFDIEYGLFWTIDDVNISDIQLNFNRSVEKWDERKAQRESMVRS